MASAETYIAQSPDIACSTLGDDTIIMSTRDSTVFVLNSVGTAIWQGADGATPLSHIVDEKVCAEFDVAGDEAMADAKEFVDELVRHGILSVSSVPVSPNEVL
jgi:Coenzyme PQQ synthesis protein D (PqqD)